MTYGFANIIGITQANAGGKPIKGVLYDPSALPFVLRKLYDYALGCHIGHALDFAVALICYLTIWPLTFPEAGVLHWRWIGIVVAFNLCTEFTLYGFWHWMTYSKGSIEGGMKNYKYNKDNQYGDASAGHLTREVLLTTAGWLQSSLWQVAMMHAWASGRLPFTADFFLPSGHPDALRHAAWAIGMTALVTYWREFHFYWVHRFIHPWGLTGAWKSLDLGAFLYKHVHSLHHKSYSPGPFSGLSMHPVEHLIYYTCTLLPLLYPAHPIHFLFAKFHADIAPIGGHDGYANPGGGGDHHYLHHAKFELNYGVPLVDFDRLFGTWVDYEVFKACGGDLVKAKAVMRQQGWLFQGGKEEAAAAVAAAGKKGK